MLATKKIVSNLMALVFAVSFAVQPAGAGSVRYLPGPTLFEVGNSVVSVKHRKYKRRKPKTGEIIAGAILLGVLGAAASNSGTGDYHYDDHYDTVHEDYIRQSERRCRLAARQRYRLVAGRGRLQANTRHVAYLGGNRYEVRGRVRKVNGAGSRRFVCRTRLGRVRRLDLI